MARADFRLCLHGDDIKTVVEILLYLLLFHLFLHLHFFQCGGRFDGTENKDINTNDSQCSVVFLNLTKRRQTEEGR